MLKQLVVPVEYRSRVMQSIHDDMDHPGRDQTLELAKSRFYWPGMLADLENKIRSCRRCICRKGVTRKAPLHPILTTRPLELVCVEYLLVEPSAGYEHLLVITDHFTKFSRVVPTRNESVKTTAKALYEFMNLYGYPEKLHSDQGRNFESRIIQELCTMCGVVKSRTTPYHAQGNGACERMNQTLLKMLGTLSEDKKSRWEEYLNSIVYAYNCTPHETTSYSPYALMFARSPQIAIDIELGLVNGGECSYRKFVQGMRDRLKYSHNAAQEAMKSAADRAKANF
jgi:transposase InsO family protein